MKTRQAIADRRSIRQFRPDPILEEALEAILLAATQAPSGIRGHLLIRLSAPVSIRPRTSRHRENCFCQLKTRPFKRLDTGEQSFPGGWFWVDGIDTAGFIEQIVKLPSYRDRIVLCWPRNVRPPENLSYRTAGKDI